MKNSHLSAILELVRAVFVVIPKFNKMGRQMGRMSTLERVFQSLGIVVSEEDSVLEDIVEASGKEEEDEQGQGAETLSVRSLSIRVVQRVWNYLYFSCHVKPFRELTFLLTMFWDDS